MQNPHELKIRHEASDPFLTVAASNRVHTPLLSGVLWGRSWRLMATVSQFISRGGFILRAVEWNGSEGVPHDLPEKGVQIHGQKKATDLETSSGSV